MGVQISPARVEHSEGSQPSHGELQRSQAQLQALQEGRAAAIDEKEAALHKCAELQHELSKMKVQHPDGNTYKEQLTLQHEFVEALRNLLLP